MSKFGNFMKKSVTKTGKFWQKNGSKIMHVTGLVADPAATVVACVQTRKLDKVLAPHTEEIEKIRSTKDENPDTYGGDLAKAYASAAGDIAKLYAPVAILEGISVGCRIGDHHHLKNELLKQTASCVAITEAYNQYRSRVIKDQGYEKDFEYATGCKVKVEEHVDPETGEITKKRVIEGKPENTIGSISFVFDDRSPLWSNNAQQNLSTIIGLQNIANNNNDAIGSIRLYEIIEMFQLEKSYFPAYIYTHGYEYNPRQQYKISFGEVNDILRDGNRIENYVACPIIITLTNYHDLAHLHEDLEKERIDDVIDAEFCKRKAIEEEIGYPPEGYEDDDVICEVTKE